MAQNKKQVEQIGGNIFMADAIEFVRSWEKPVAVDRSALTVILFIAAWPERAAVIYGGELWTQNPELISELFVFLRSKWKAMDRSKSSRVKKFLATKSMMIRGATLRPMRAEKLLDEEIARAFSYWALNNCSRKDVATKQDVHQARRWVNKMLSAGRKAERAFRNDGFVYSKLFRKGVV